MYKPYTVYIYIYHTYNIDLYDRPYTIYTVFIYLMCIFFTQTEVGQSMLWTFTHNHLPGVHAG